ncbi:MAG: NADH-quinone oxidoreductase subunit N [Bacteroidales bacterium]|nr:NADH-quinone oxidoreductase subunit N [Bacteroidales bacterium]
MTALDFICLAPFLLLASAPIIIMLTITITRNIKVVYGFSLLMFLLSFISLFIVAPYIPHVIAPLFIIDSYSLLFLAIIIFAGFLITILSYIYISQQGDDKEEYFIILFVAALGASVLVVANHFISFFLGLETLSISLYILVAYIKTRSYSIEAGVKFLVIASVASAFLLFGMGLIYTATGSMNFKGVASALGSLHALSPILLTGFVMLLVGIGFKLALVPFHMWLPDVYQGAPAPVTALIATISKGAVLAIALRFFMDIQGFNNQAIFIALSAIAIISMFTGNLLALNQGNLKRMLAYSSIAHFGYLLITLLAGSTEGIHSAIFYIASYIITTLGAFGIISLLSVCSGNADSIDDYKGLFYKNPFMAIVMSLAMLSLAGIPLTAGFIAKFYLVLAGVKSGLWLLAFSLVINSVISLYYYLRVVTTMFTTSDQVKPSTIPLMGNLVLVVIVIGILFLGILPAWVSDIIASLS